MLIGVDLDEVLADLVSQLLKYHNFKYGTNLNRREIRSYNLWETWGGTREGAVRKIHEFYGTPSFREIKPVEGSIEAVETLCRACKMSVITSRPRAISRETEEWICKHFPEKFSGIYFTNEWAQSGESRKKSEICRELGAELIIEDSLEYAKECASCGIPVLLLDCPWNQSALPEGIARVFSWKEIVKRIL